MKHIIILHVLLFFNLAFQEVIGLDVHENMKVRYTEGSSLLDQVILKISGSDPPPPDLWPPCVVALGCKNLPS